MGWFTKKVGGEYELGKTIGKGHFSKVKYGVNLRTKEKVAIKVMERKALQDENMEEQVKREIAIMKRLNHPNITKLKAVYQTKRHVYLVLELVTGGELFDKIVESKRFTEEIARKYFHQLIMGTLYCHTHGVAHRDLKPENLMLDENGDLKISDFGLSNMQSTNAEGAVTNQLQTMCGTPEYVAPEVLSGHGYSGFTADCWSCGVILYVMLSGSLPFRDSDHSSVFQKIRQAKYDMKPYFSAEVKELISHLLVVDPAKRYTLEQVVQHPWFQVAFDPKLLAEATTVSSVAVDQSDINGAIEHVEEDDEHEQQGQVEKSTSKAPVATEPVDMLDDLHRRASFTRSTFVERNTRFGLRGTPEAVSEQLVKELAAVGAHPECKDNPYCIKCSKENNNGILTFTVLISRTTQQDDISVVEIRRGRGQIIDFNEAYRKLLEGIEAHQLGPGDFHDTPKQ